MSGCGTGSVRERVESAGCIWMLLKETLGKRAAGGDLNLGFTDLDDPEAVRENRRRFVAALTGSELAGSGLMPPGAVPLGDAPLALVRQVHSNRSVLIRAADGCLAQPGTVEADGLLSDEPGRLIGILTADCIPVLVADPEHRAVAAFHAGWRGTVERIVELGLERMREGLRDRSRAGSGGDRAGYRRVLLQSGG